MINRMLMLTKPARIWRRARTQTQLEFAHLAGSWDEYAR
ncbi:hypothetical protein BOMU111920_21065 [Bordetella muralis]